jgi:hypothetical protein
MPRVAEIKAIFLSLEVGGEKTLFILLSEDGTINRMGNGQLSYPDRESLYMGRTTEPLFAKLRSHLTDDMLRYMGRYDAPKKVGEVCCFKIGLQFADGSANGFEIDYGSESDGRPQELVDFLHAALDVTDPWYRTFQNNRGPQRGGLSQT